MKTATVVIPIVSCSNCKFHHNTTHPSVSYCEKIKMHQEALELKEKANK